MVLVVGTTLVYLNSFPGAFHFDDYALLLDNPRVTGPAFSYVSFLDHYAGRPLTLWTFHWNYHWSGPNPAAFLSVNVFLHVLVVLELFVLLWMVFKDRRLAFVSALLFALHPLQTQAVNYVWSRSVLLMAVFGLGCLILQKRESNHNDTTSATWWSLCRRGFPLAMLQLAIWSRTEAVVLAVPLVLLNRSRWRGPAVLTALNLAAFVYSMARYSPEKIGWNHPDPLSHWILQPVAFWNYIALMIWPAGLNVDHDLTAPSAWVVLLAGAVSGILIWSIYRWRCERPLPVISASWIVLMLAPSLLIPNPDPLNESRAYLAVAGLTLLAGWLICRSLGRIRPVLGMSAFGLVLALLVPLTVSRNEIWKDDLALWQDAVTKSPAKARAHYNLGVALARRGHDNLAEAEFRTAQALNPEDDFNYAALGYCAELRYEFDEAANYYHQALALNPRNDYARDGLQRFFSREGE